MGGEGEDEMRGHKLDVSERSLLKPRAEWPDTAAPQDSTRDAAGVSVRVLTALCDFWGCRHVRNTGPAFRKL